MDRHTRSAEAAPDKARRALRRLSRSREPVSFTAVAKAAGVSTDFLYRHAELRAQIERQRAPKAKTLRRRHVILRSL
jgi:hypothetical protein